MFHFARFAKRFALSLLILGAAANVSAQTGPPAYANMERKAEPVDPKDAPVHPVSSKAEKADSKSGPTLRVLPEGLDANPPSPEDLKAQNLTWKGEYEATKDGQPVLGPDSRPIPALYNAKGKRVKSKVKPLHSRPITVTAGTLTVDGWTGKARLNYDIPEQSFLYFSAPSIGTVVVSQTAFPGSREQKQALDGNTLTVHLPDHDLQLASDKPLLPVKKAVSVWVRVDPEFHQDPLYPVMGFGPVTKPPYAWPPAKLLAQKGAGKAPPLPRSMQPAVVAGCNQKPGQTCLPTAPAGVKGMAASPEVSTTATSPTAAVTSGR